MSDDRDYRDLKGRESAYRLQQTWQHLEVYRSMTTRSDVAEAGRARRILERYAELRAKGREKSAALRQAEQENPAPPVRDYAEYRALKKRP